MLVQPATSDDVGLLAAWWAELGRDVSRDIAATDALSWLELQAADMPKILIALQKGEQVGSMIIEPGRELRWFVSPEHRGRGFGKRMVGLVAEPHDVARIKCSDLASQAIADHAGFDLVHEAEIQLWRATRTKPYR